MTVVAVRPAANRRALWDRLGTLRSRFAFRFSPDGSAAAGLVTDGRGFLYPEVWRFTGTGPHCRGWDHVRFAAAELPHDGEPVDIVPVGPDRLVMIRRTARSTTLTALRPDAPSVPLGEVPATRLAVHQLPHLPGTLLLLGCLPDGSGAAWTQAGAAEPVLLGRLAPIVLVGGGPVGDTGWIVNTRDDGTVSPSILDLRTGVTRPLSDTRQPTTALAAAAGRIVLAVGPPAHARLAVARVGEVPRMLTMDVPDVELRPLALDPAGTRLAVAVTRGVRTTLGVVDLDRDELTEPPIGAGSTPGPAAWFADELGAGVRCLFLAPDRPIAVLEHRTPPAARVAVYEDDCPGTAFTGWAPSTVTTLPGAAGPIETVACGHTDWRDARIVVLALHGGPASAWTLKFDPLMQLVAAGDAVVLAPNQRGSTGYGAEHHEAIHHAWGGPDLDDVLVVAEHVSTTRGGDPLRLHGVSYGAYLALLAAAARPRLWTRVAAVAPFTTGRRLHAVASPPVRAMIDRLGGRTTAPEGRNDVLRVVDAIRADTLIVHGADDPLIPVSEARLIRDRLRESRGDTGFRYVEVAGAGHSPIDGSADLHLLLADFLTDERR